MLIVGYLPIVELEDAKTLRGLCENPRVIDISLPTIFKTISSQIRIGKEEKR